MNRTRIAALIATGAVTVAVAIASLGGPKGTTPHPSLPPEAMYGLGAAEVVIDAKGNAHADINEIARLANGSAGNYDNFHRQHNRPKPGEQPGGAFPGSFTLPHLPAVLNQHSTPQCVAYSSANADRWLDRTRDGSFPPLMDEAAFFSQIGGTSGGAYLSAALSHMKATGYPHGTGHQSDHRLAKYWTVSPTRTGIETALTDGSPVLVISRWPRNWFTPNSAGVLPSPGLTIAGGHAFWLVGYNATGAIGENSWGTSWGASGFFTIRWADIAYPWHYYAMTVAANPFTPKPVPTATPKPTPKPTPRPTPVPTPSPHPTVVPSPSRTVQPTATPARTVTPLVTAAPSPSRTPAASFYPASPGPTSVPLTPVPSVGPTPGSSRFRDATVGITALLVLFAIGWVAVALYRRFIR